MASTRALSVTISGDASKLTAATRKAEADLEKVEGTAKRTGDGMGASFMKAGAMMTTAGVAIGAALVSMAKAYDEQVQADLKLKNTIENQPQLVGESISAFQDQAEAIQLVTVAGDDQVETAQSMLGMFGATKDQILELTPLVVDYSRKMGVDMETAAKNVGKAIDGKATALTKSGIAIDATAYAADRYTAVQQGLSVAVGGFAQQEGATFSGRVEIMKNQLGELQEGVGKGVVDAFSKALGPVAALNKGFQALDPEMQSGIGTVLAFGSAALVAGGGVAMLSDKIGMSKGNMVMAGAAAAGLAAGLSLVNSSLTDANKAAAETFKNFDPTAGFDKVVAQRNEISAAIEAETGKHNEQGILARFWNHQELTDLEKKQAQLAEVDKGIEAQRATYSRLGSELGIGAEAAKRLGAELGIDPNTVPYERLKTVVAEYSTGALTAEQAADKLKQMNQGVTQSVDEMQKEYDDAKRAVDEFGRKIMETLGIGDQVQLKQLGLRDQIDALGKTLTENGTQWDWVNGRITDNTAKGRENQEALLKTKQSIIEYGVEVGKQAGSTQAGTDAIAEMTGRLRDQMLQHGYSSAQVDEYIAKLNLTPDQVTTAFNRPGVQEAMNEVGDLNGKLDRTAQGAHAPVTADTSQANAALDSLAQRLFGGLTGTVNVQPLSSGGRAAGGPVTAGRMYEVNERGAPELLTVGGRQMLMMGAQSGEVTPMDRSAGGGSSVPTGGGTLVVPVSIDGREVVRALVDLDVAYSNSAGW